jgi:hypothetical protein
MNRLFKFLTAFVFALAPIGASAQIALTGAGPGVIGRSGGAGGSYVANAVHFTGAASLVPIANTIKAQSAFYQAVPITGAPSCTNCGTSSQVNTIAFGGGQLFGTPGSVYISGITGSGPNAWSGSTFPISSSSAGTLSYACPNCGTFVSVSSPRAWTESFPVSSCTGVLANATVVDQTVGPGPVPQTLGNVGACSGTTLTLGPRINSAGASDTLAVTGAIASADSCSFILSFWHRGTETYPPPGYNADGYLSMVANTDSQASGETVHGIGIRVDVNGIRLNVGNQNANTTNDTANFVISSANVASWLSNGNWHHILWSMNTCGAAQGVPVRGGYAATGIGSQFYIDGVQRNSNALASGVAADGSGYQTYTQWRKGVAWGNPGGFTINFGVNSTEYGMADDDWADLQLWVGKDVVCGGTSTSYGTNAAGGCGASTNVISPSDVANFINGSGLPVNPATAQAAYGTPTVSLTGNSAVWNSGGTTSSYTQLGFFGPAYGSSNWGAMSDLTTSPSFYNPSNSSGEPAHTIGFKWGCSTSLVAPASFAEPACSKNYATGDLLLAAAEVSWTTFPTAGVTCGPAPSGWSVWTGNGIGGVTTGSAAAYATFCLYYTIVGGGSGAPTAGTSNFAGFSMSYSGGSVRDGAVMLVDYGNYNNTLPTVDAVGTMSYANNPATLSAPGMPLSGSFAANNEMAIGFFYQVRNQQGPYLCPAGWTKRMDISYVGGTTNNTPALLACDQQLSSTTPLSAQAASVSQSYGGGGGGAMLSVAPN